MYLDLPCSRKSFKLATPSLWFVQLVLHVHGIHFPGEYRVIFEASQNCVTHRYEEHLRDKYGNIQSVSSALADPGGGGIPFSSNSFHFLAAFGKKSCQIIGFNFVLNSGVGPIWKILDPLLVIFLVSYCPQLCLR